MPPLTKLLIDCSKAVNDPDHAREVPLTQAELDRQPIEEQAGLRRQEDRNRRSRDGLLAQSDWTALPDAPLSDTQKNAWLAYRQQLRDWDMTRSDFPNSPGRR